MILPRIKFFSDKEAAKRERKEIGKNLKGLKVLDKSWKLGHNISSRKGLEDVITLNDSNSSDEDFKAARKRSYKRTAKNMIPLLAAKGAIDTGLMAADYVKRGGMDKRDAVGLTAAGAVGGATRGALISGIPSLVHTRRRSNAKKGNEKSLKKQERRRDIANVGLGNMTSDDFRKKWYNEKKD
jgi:hypothetical protein